MVTSSSASPRPLRIGACLSLSGRFARFGRQAAAALDTWRDFDGRAELVIEDDESGTRVLKSSLPRVMENCEVLLGPYSTQLTRAAGRLAADSGRLIWNHGGSGDDIETAFPGTMLSVLTPASRYARPFIRRLASRYPPAPLLVLQGRGSFGRQVRDGAEAAARRAGIEIARSSDRLAGTAETGDWDLFSAGTFEDDVQAVATALRSPSPPRTVCSVAAGVREFREHIRHPEGVYGVGQWFPAGASGARPALGPDEASFLKAYAHRGQAAPDYPAIQAAAAAIVASHCVRQAAGTSPETVWQVAASLDTDTLFGNFRIDPRTGVQIGHQAGLVRWTAQRAVAL